MRDVHANPLGIGDLIREVVSVQRLSELKLLLYMYTSYIYNPGQLLMLWVCYKSLLQVLLLRYVIVIHI
jgi:hypothetical protein